MKSAQNSHIVNSINRLYALIILFAWMPVGCGGGGSNASNVAVQIQDYQLSSNGLNGHGNIIALSYTDMSNIGATTGFKETLKIYQQDSINPDLLLDLGAVYLGVDTLYHSLADLTLNSQWATVTINYTDTVFAPPQTWVSLVSLSNNQYSLKSLLNFPGIAIDRAVAMGNWLLVAANTDLAVYDISTPTTPTLNTTFTLSAGTTSMVGLTNGFYVITNNGFGYIDVSNPQSITLTEHSNVDIKQSKKVYSIGSKLYIGGPSKYAGKIKIARVDVSSPDSPTTEVINDLIDGTFSDFSYDSFGDSYYIQTYETVRQFKESGGVLQLNKSATLTSYQTSPSHFYAYGGRIYNGKWGFVSYRMP